MNTKNTTDSIPSWDLSDLYPGFSSPEYLRDSQMLRDSISSLQTRSAEGFQSPEDLLEALTLYETVSSLYENLQSFAYARYSVNTADPEARAELGKLEETDPPLSQALTFFRNSLARTAGSLNEWTAREEKLQNYAFFLEQQLVLQSHQMSPELEHLAADLSRSGGEAWSRLQQTVSSRLSGLWTHPVTGVAQEKTVTELRALAFDPDRQVRKSAWEQELKLWQQVEIPMAAALNGVKGTALTLAGRRNWNSPLEKAVFQSRLSQTALEAMIAAMESSLPRFRAYFRKKAQYLGIGACAFFDIFAPVPSRETPKTWTYEEAREFICGNFREFSPEMGAFAEHAFARNWIDAKPASGKVGGAYCTSFPVAKESRILANFSGSYSDVGTLAHELGHAYHHHVLKDALQTQREYPMTLAETASIFCETVVFHRAVELPGSDALLLAESFIQDCAQVIVDILSRYYFEKAVFTRRKETELSAEDLCRLMTEAQQKTYGDGLDSAFLHPYMWAVKGHYYSPSLGFYNFPYAFGLLFGLGLYETYKKEGSRFAGTYRTLLSRTGTTDAVSLCREAGFDIETENFWRTSLGAVYCWIDRFIDGMS
ncbi:MAG: M3 family oligoendopeptidase [Spirochaetales bacterium]|nr:M3 family oligoendopeptidase [Spirochaetales bacterium]